MGIVWICSPVRILERKFYIAWHFPQGNYGLGKKRGEWSLTKKSDRGIEKGKERGDGREGVRGYETDWAGSGRGSHWAEICLCHALLWDGDKLLTLSDVHGHICRGRHQGPHPHVVAGIMCSAGSPRRDQWGAAGKMSSLLHDLYVNNIYDKRTSGVTTRWMTSVNKQLKGGCWNRGEGLTFLPGASLVVELGTVPSVWCRWCVWQADGMLINVFVLGHLSCRFAPSQH